MEFILSRIIEPCALPAIMLVACAKLKNTDANLLYLTNTWGLVLATCSLYLRVNNFSRSKIFTLGIIPTLIGYQLIQKSELDLNDLRQRKLDDFVPELLILFQAWICSTIGQDLICKAPRRFTFGEATIVSQLVSAALLNWMLAVYSRIGGPIAFRTELTSEVVLNIGFIFSIIAFLGIHVRTSATRYSLLVLGTLLSYLVTKSLVATPRISDPLTWLIDYLFATHHRVGLFSLWISTLGACISFATSWSRLVGQTNSLVRKVFHLATCAVFITGYNQDIDFTRFASGAMLVVMFVLELIRIWDLWPLGKNLERVCNALRGKWDNRYLTLSHMYLLVGTMLPLWILPKDDEISKILLSSGLISVGIGDTAAAVVGTLFGRTKLGVKSEKTIEGLLANVISMVLFKLIWIGFSGALKEFGFIMAAMSTALVETISKNCDNLILPLVMILFLQIF